MCLSWNVRHRKMAAYYRPLTAKSSAMMRPSLRRWVSTFQNSKRLRWICPGTCLQVQPVCEQINKQHDDWFCSFRTTTIAVGCNAIQMSIGRHSTSDLLPFATCSTNYTDIILNENCGSKDCHRSGPLQKWLLQNCPDITYIHCQIIYVRK